MDKDNPLHSPREIAQAIAGDHAFDYHVLGQSREVRSGLAPNPIRFGSNPAYGAPLDIQTRPQFEEHIFHTLTDERTIGYRRTDGGAVFYNEQSNTLVFYDPTRPHLGTSTRNNNGMEAFISAYEKDMRQGRAGLIPSEALHAGGWDSVLRQQIPRNVLSQGVADVNDVRQQMAEIGIQTHDVDGSPLSRPLSAEEFSSRVLRAESHASRTLGAASLAVNVGEGDYTAAAVDAASMVADSKVGASVAEAVVEGVAKLGPKAAFIAAAQVGKRLPVVGAVITTGFVLASSGAHAMNGDYQLAGAELAAGGAEIAGNVVGFGAGDAAREAARSTMIAVGGDEFAAVEKSGIRQIGEGAYALGERMLSDTPPQGQPLEAVLPANYRSMTLGSDAMGDRGEVSRIAIERSGFAANDPRNNLTVLSSEIAAPRAHLLILPDGSVQGPESGGVAFGNNPSIAAGVNGGTLGIMYAGTGAMNDAQYATMQSTTEWLTAQRGRDGLTTPVEVIAGSLNTAQILQIPTPQGFTPGIAPEPGAEGPSVLLQQRKVSNGMGGV